MINKKNVLGKEPDELGQKDAIHTAIVSVRAACAIDPGQRCGLNEHREATPDRKGPGVADPFRKGTITRGGRFWLLLCQDEVPNVRHEWEHPTVDFSPPARPAVMNSLLAKYATALGVTYEQLMDAAAYVVEKDRPAPYPGEKTQEELDAAWEEQVESYDLWGEWAAETNYEFEDQGSACCPEPCYPDCRLF